MNTTTKQRNTRLIEQRRQHGDIAEVARRAGVKYQSAYQYIRGTRAHSKGRIKYLEILANVIADRAKAEKEETKIIEKILQPCTQD